MSQIISILVVNSCNTISMFVASQQMWKLPKDMSEPVSTSPVSLTYILYSIYNYLCMAVYGRWVIENKNTLRNTGLYLFVMIEKLIQVDQWNTITLLENVLPLPYTLIWLQSVLNEDDSSESIFATDINKVCHSRKGTFHTEIHPILPQNCQTWHFFGL